MLWSPSLSLEVKKAGDVPAQRSAAATRDRVNAEISPRGSQKAEEIRQQRQQKQQKVATTSRERRRAIAAQEVDTKEEVLPGRILRDGDSKAVGENGVYVPLTRRTRSDGAAVYGVDVGPVGKGHRRRRLENGGVGIEGQGEKSAFFSLEGPIAVCSACGCMYKECMQCF